MQKHFLRNVPNIMVGRWAAWLLLGVLALVGLGAGLFTWLLPSVVVEWTTGSELDTVGYNLYRSESPSGDYVRVNSQLIPAKGDSLAGAQYTYTDRGVKAGLRYYYLLEDVNSEGSPTRHGPREVQPAGAAQWILAGILFGGGLLGLGILAVRCRRGTLAAA